ncbi:MAG TPA: TetR/AcrR family transcriptional regulator [Rhodocyclaceae bacterium]|nr:TetR/AcrR family transcriptional regulator [Rhodocyclaceae bacterium]
MTTSQDSVHPREAILDAAMQLFGKRGYNGTTMRDIANAVSMLPGSLYAHIDGKETLLVELVESGIERFLAIEQMLGSLDGSPLFRMRAAIKAHLAVVAENPGRALVVFHQWRFLSEPNLPRALEKRGRYQRIFTTLVEDGVESGDFSGKLDVRIAAFSILGALNWTAEWYSPEGPDSVDELGEKIADTLLSGLVYSGRDVEIVDGRPAAKTRAGKKS